MGPTIARSWVREYNPLEKNMDFGFILYCGNSLGCLRRFVHSHTIAKLDTAAHVHAGSHRSSRPNSSAGTN